MVATSSFEEVISLIKDRLDIVEVVSEYVPLKRSGANFGGYVLFITIKNRQCP